MFAIEYVEPTLKKKFSNLNKYFPPEVCQELPQFLEALKQKGEISKVDFLRGNIKKLDAPTFELQYVSDFDKKIVKILEMKVKSIELLKTRFSITDSWDDKDVLECIPQCDKPQKMFLTLEFINQGIDNSYEIGLKLGSNAKQKKDVRRHGQYALEALEELRLIQRTRESRKVILTLTEKGKLIAEAPDEETKKRLLIEAMLNYRPVWLIIGEVTKGAKELTDELVKTLVFLPEEQEADTSNRRSQTLKNWVKFISKFTGIPIYLQGQALQLTIPMLYAEKDSEQNL